MDPNANVNYEELKDTTKSFLQMVTDNDFYYAVFLLIILKNSYLPGRFIGSHYPSRLAPEEDTWGRLTA